MKKNLLFLTSQLPELSSGSQVRSYYMLQHMQHDFNVTICCVTDHDVDVDTYKKDVFQNTYVYPIAQFTLFQRIRALLQGSIPYVERYRQSIPVSELKRLFHETDICFFSELNGYLIAQNVIDLYTAKKIMDAHNIEYIKFAGEVASKNILQRILGYFVTPAMKRIEKHALQQMDLTFACSLQDKQLYSKLAPDKQILEIPNGVDSLKFNPTNKQFRKNSLFFMGSLGYPPNDDALKYFLESIYPRIKKKLPNVHFTIIGKGARKWLQNACGKDRSITLKGFVPDVREYISNAHVCICPLRFGSGTRLKILEYMSMGKAVVSTFVGAEGIQIEDHINILLAKNENTFVNAVLEVVEDEALQKEISSNARALIVEKYDWNRILAPAVRSISGL